VAQHIRGVGACYAELGSDRRCQLQMKGVCTEFRRSGGYPLPVELKWSVAEEFGAGPGVSIRAQMEKRANGKGTTEVGERLKN
jgi:hypothetical protein